MAGRPPKWFHIQQTHNLREYQFSREGRFRDRSHNVLPQHNGEVRFRLETGERVAREARTILAPEYLGGWPAAEHCCVCTRPLPFRVEHINADRDDASADNLLVFADRDHERRCLQRMMHTPVPRRRQSGRRPGLPSA